MTIPPCCPPMPRAHVLQRRRRAHARHIRSTPPCAATPAACTTPRGNPRPLSSSSVLHPARPTRLLPDRDLRLQGIDELVHRRQRPPCGARPRSLCGTTATPPAPCPRCAPPSSPPALACPRALPRAARSSPPPWAGRLIAQCLQRSAPFVFSHDALEDRLAAPHRPGSPGGAFLEPRSQRPLDDGHEHAHPPDTMPMSATSSPPDMGASSPAIRRFTASFDADSEDASAGHAAASDCRTPPTRAGDPRPPRPTRRRPTPPG